METDKDGYLKPRRKWRVPPENGLITNQVIADLLRSVADGRASTGDVCGARRARAGARLIERRDGDPYRKHRRTRIEGT